MKFFTKHLKMVFLKAYVLEQLALLYEIIITYIERRHN